MAITKKPTSKAVAPIKKTATKTTKPVTKSLVKETKMIKKSEPKIESQELSFDTNKSNVSQNMSEEMMCAKSKNCNTHSIMIALLVLNTIGIGIMLFGTQGMVDKIIGDFFGGTENYNELKQVRQSPAYKNQRKMNVQNMKTNLQSVNQPTTQQPTVTTEPTTTEQP